MQNMGGTMQSKGGTMVSSGLINSLIPEGAVMAGNRPKTILADGSGGGSDPGYYDTSALGNLLRTMQTRQIQGMMKQEEETKKQKNIADMYKTLRDAGYEPKKAFEASMAGMMPHEPGGATVKETVAAARSAKVKTEPKIKLRDRLMEKMANGENLNPGEQKVYDEVIRKYGQKSDLDTVLKNKANKIDTAGYVKMVNPAGQNKLVPKANVDKAKAKGWKLR